ncbi:MAG: hypothetical protein JWP91_310 [Fibrobacteres bacterium]|nr:hypothetical protein [Fibrobacterota bacterium]
MRMGSLSVLFLLPFVGCMSDNAKSSSQISTHGICEEAAPKESASDKASLDSNGILIFASKDSLQGTFKAGVPCKTTHEERTGFKDDSTLKVDYVYPGGPQAGCACFETITLTAKSTDHDLMLIRRVEFNGFTFTLRAPNP